ncbi:hypothetical protein SUDANB105_00241 [Streptomyces sp. enrichment culture]
MAGRKAARQDAVATIIDDWARERPELDTSPLDGLARLHRTFLRYQTSLTAAIERHGLAVAGFDVLTALRRAGKPYRLTAGQLADSGLISSAGVTLRIDRLEKDGLIVRARRCRPNPRAGPAGPRPRTPPSPGTPARSGCSPAATGAAPWWSASCGSPGTSSTTASRPGCRPSTRTATTCRSPTPCSTPPSPPARASRAVSSRRSPSTASAAAGSSPAVWAARRPCCSSCPGSAPTRRCRSWSERRSPPRSSSVPTSASTSTRPSCSPPGCGRRAAAWAAPSTGSA